MNKPEEGFYNETPVALQLDSLRLAMKVVRSGFKPDMMIALWRGGAPIGLYVHEALKYHGIGTDHIAIRTSHYTAPGQTKSTIEVHNLGYVRERIQSGRIFNILIVDDVWESGGSICALLRRLQEDLPKDQGIRLDIKFAVLFFKPDCNKTPLLPDYYVHKADKDIWIHFPHELDNPEHLGEDVLAILKQ